MARPENEAAIELIKEWFNDPDELPEWWDEYEDDIKRGLQLGIDNG